VPIIAAVRTALVVLAMLVVACHPHAGAGGGGHVSPYVGTYPALRWVPADATFVVTTRHTSDAVAILRELGNVAGVLVDADLSELEDEMRRHLGFDPLSTDSLTEIGVDVNGGVAIFSQGLSPTFAIPLSDPAHIASLIEQLRAGGVAVEVSREQGIDVYTFAGDRDVHLHWAIADRWLFVHVEITDEHEGELAWYRALRSADGGFASGPDLAAAQARAVRPAAPAPRVIDPAGGAATAAPPMLGVVKLAELRARLARLGAKRDCLDVGRATGRAFLAAGADGKDTTAAIAVEVTGTGPADAIIAGPAGWARARGDAAMQAEWNVDLDKVGALIAPCDASTARDLTSQGVLAVRAFVQALDIKDLSGRGAVFLAAHDNHLAEQALDNIPGLSLASRHRKVGAADVVDVSMPMIPSFSYAMTSTTTTAAVGEHLIDQVLGDGRAVRDATLAHVELHPWAFTPEVWDTLLEAAGAGGKDRRARFVRRMRRWDLQRLDVSAASGAVIITAHGHAH